MFIFSAGWRSGSTLLQRLLLASGRVLIWGEPYDRGEPIPALLRIPACFGPLWPRSDALVDEFLKTRGRESVSELKNEWTANLYPPIDSLVNAQLAFFEHFFRRPAEKLGCPRWGVKEVRLSIEHALYLKWLYPKARFLFLYRNPEAAYRSYQRLGGRWYKSWPDEPVVGPRAFGEHWRSLLEGFLDGWDRVDGLLVSYEDLTSDPATRKRIADHTGIAIPIDESLEPVASLAARQRVPVSGRALRTLWKTVGPVAQRVGYRPGV